MNLKKFKKSLLGLVFPIIFSGSSFAQSDSIIKDTINFQNGFRMPEDERTFQIYSKDTSFINNKNEFYLDSLISKYSNAKGRKLNSNDSLEMFQYIDFINGNKILEREEIRYSLFNLRLLGKNKTLEAVEKGRKKYLKEGIERNRKEFIKAQKKGIDYKPLIMNTLSKYEKLIEIEKDSTKLKLYKSDTSDIRNYLRKIE